MILCLVFFYLFGGSTITTTVVTVNKSISKSIMCYYDGRMTTSNTELVDVEPNEIPCECSGIIYSRFSIDLLSNVNVDFALLKSVTDLNKPVILTLLRSGNYGDWSKFLSSDCNKQYTETQFLCNFAIENNVTGYLIEDLTPQSDSIPLNYNVTKYIVPYIKQLSKCKPDFIIGVSVEAHGSIIKNSYMYNFQELNDLVTFYEINTFKLNNCNPTLYNGMTPIKMREHGANYLLGMEEIASFIKDSQINPTKIVYDIEMFPLEIVEVNFYSYSQVCRGLFNITGGCVQNTKQFYDKGKFAIEQHAGIIVKIIDLDDAKNECCCDSKFIGFKNIIAGFQGGSQIACKKFDVQSSDCE